MQAANDRLAQAKEAARAAGLTLSEAGGPRPRSAATRASATKIADVAVLAHLGKGKANGKTVGEITRAGAWPDTKAVSAALKSLVDQGRAAKEGQRRATRYYVL